MDTTEATLNLTATQHRGNHPGRPAPISAQALSPRCSPGFPAVRRRTSSGCERIQWSVIIIRREASRRGM